MFDHDGIGKRAVEDPRYTPNDMARDAVAEIATRENALDDGLELVRRVDDGWPALEAALAKVQRRRLQPPAEREAFTREEVEALSLWLNLQLAFEGKETRTERSERNKAAWAAGDRRQWGGERRKRDPRRGWRNFIPRD